MKKLENTAIDKPRVWNRRIRQTCCKCGLSFWPGVKVCGVGDKTRHVKCPERASEPIESTQTFAFGRFW